MPTYKVKSRTTGPITVADVEAPTSQDAILKTMEATPEGASVEVMQVVELPPDVVTPAFKKEK